MSSVLVKIRDVLILFNTNITTGVGTGAEMGDGTGIKRGDEMALERMLKRRLEGGVEGRDNMPPPLQVDL